jgi:hypothetical protein
MQSLVFSSEQVPFVLSIFEQEPEEELMFPNVT